MGCWEICTPPTDTSCSESFDLGSMGWIMPILVCQGSREDYYGERRQAGQQSAEAMPASRLFKKKCRCGLLVTKNVSGTVPCHSLHLAGGRQKGRGRERLARSRLHNMERMQLKSERTAARGGQQKQCGYGRRGGRRSVGREGGATVNSGYYDTAGKMQTSH